MDTLNPVYERAIAIWLCNKYPHANWSEDQISHISFEREESGGCPTCEYTEFGIQFRITETVSGKKGPRQKSHTQFYNIEMEKPAQFICEVSQIISNLQGS